MRDITIIHCNGERITDYLHDDDLLFEGGSIYDERGLRVATNYGIIGIEDGMSDKERAMHRRERRKRKYV